MLKMVLIPDRRLSVSLSANRSLGGYLGGYQGRSFHPRTKPMPTHHSATTSGRALAY